MGRSGRFHLRLVGIEKVFPKGKAIDEDVIAFHTDFFKRMKEIRNARPVARYLRYQSEISEVEERVFMGVEVPRISTVPAGMVAWTLTNDTFELLQRVKGSAEVKRRSIDWRWTDLSHGSSGSWVTGEFFFTGGDLVGQLGGGAFSVATGSSSGNRSEFIISANGYTDPTRQVGDGDKVVLAEYDPSWPDQYRKFADWLEGYLGSDIVLRTEHFGSTAVPGMAAKPVIDVMVEIPSFDDARRRMIPLLNDKAWEYWWTDDHMVFIKRDGFLGRRTHHVHAAPAGHPLWQRLAFRDYLREHQDVAAEYAELKRDLAARYEGDRERYTIAKADFIRRVTAEARE